MNSERRGLVVVVAVLLVSAVLGGIYGPNVRATTASADDYQTAVRDFTRVLNVVQNNYADSVDVDKAVYQGAIPGMLRMLDPHSSFFDAKQFALLREDQRGKKLDRKSTRLNSSHSQISYAVFCLKKKKSKQPYVMPALNATPQPVEYTT